MAAALFRHELNKKGWDDEFATASAGTWAPDGRKAASRAVEHMASLGLDISKHRARRITRQIIENADVVFTMEQGQKEALRAEFPEFKSRFHLLSEVVGQCYDIPDPMSNPDIPIEETAAEIRELIVNGFARILWLADA